MNPGKLSFWQITLSILAAAFGVQSAKNQQRDFSQKRIVIYIAGGIIFTIVFVIILVLIAKWAILASTS
jgi:uncharacterized membrane protein YvbJ